MSPRHGFPILPAHTAPLACFNCSKPLPDGDPAKDYAGYPPGGGEYRRICPACGCRTYYDIAASSAPSTT
jgi:hypothetical protein